MINNATKTITLTKEELNLICIALQYFRGHYPERTGYQMKRMWQLIEKLVDAEYNHIEENKDATLA